MRSARPACLHPMRFRWGFLFRAAPVAVIRSSFTHRTKHGVTAGPAGSTMHCNYLGRSAFVTTYRPSSPPALNNTMNERSFPPRFVLAVLATWRLTHLLAREDGPAESLARLRAHLGSSLAGKLMD